jgi:hypothetical protein
MEPIKQDLEKSVERLIVVIAAIMCMNIPMQCFGKDVSSMYIIKELESSKAGYERNIRFNYEKVIKPVLRKQELAVLDKVELEFPFKDRGGDPFRFYAKVGRERRSIVMPIFSVKFVDDLATTTAWLGVKGFAKDTLHEYISLLKYRKAKEFPHGRYPPPLEALHIPSNALEDKNVDELAQDLLKTTVIYILSRELASHYFDRPYNAKKASWNQHQERSQHIAMEWGGKFTRPQDLMLQCDAFALEIMRRIGIPPHRLTFYLSAQTYWTQNHIDFRNDEEVYMRYWHNPPEYAMFPDRLHQISDLMKWGKEDYVRQKDNKEKNISKIEQSATEIFKLSYILEKQSIQWDIKQKASELRIDDLRPRRR